MTDFWKRKLAAFLHDPSEEFLYLCRHAGGNATRTTIIGISDEEINAFNRPAVLTASAKQ